MFAQPTSSGSTHRFTVTLATVGFGCALTALILAFVAATGALGLGSTVGPGVLGLIGASLLIAASGFLPSALICAGRHRLVVAQGRESAGSVSGQNQRLGPLKGVDPSSLPSESVEASQRLVWLSGWPQIVLIASLALMSAAFVIFTWPKQSLRGDGETLLLWSGMALAAAFPFLVLERFYANTTATALPEAGALARLLRVPMLALIGNGISIATAAAGFVWSLWIEQIIGVVILVTAAELLGRAVAAAYLPGHRRQFLCGIDSLPATEPRSHQRRRPEPVRDRPLAELGATLPTARGAADGCRRCPGGLVAQWGHDARDRRARHL
jgi:hypothetical protein